MIAHEGRTLLDFYCLKSIRTALTGNAYELRTQHPPLNPFLKKSLFKFSHEFHKIAIKKIKTKNN